MILVQNKPGSLFLARKSLVENKKKMTGKDPGSAESEHLGVCFVSRFEVCPAFVFFSHAIPDSLSCRRFPALLFCANPFPRRFALLVRRLCLFFFVFGKNVSRVQCFFFFFPVFVFFLPFFLFH